MANHTDVFTLTAGLSNMARPFLNDSHSLKTTQQFHTSYKHPSPLLMRQIIFKYMPKTAIIVQPYWTEWQFI